MSNSRGMGAAKSAMKGDPPKPLLMDQDKGKKKSSTPKPKTVKPKTALDDGGGLE